jgi:hypothetical protein
VEDTLLNQGTPTAEGTTAVDRVKAVLLEKEEVLATANGELQKARAPWPRCRPHWHRKRPLLSRCRPGSRKTALSVF